ncbi:hypothetical protein H6788_00470 [Candidatus Nomurabacteria bacterium]|nr:hypothetical protein [Candidatus Nomurabacteria bacterium]MCB9819441.1 hypothetical protein [Candidatus Nomurabacteria bacterium]
MSTAFALAYIFLQKYLVPLLFAIGLIYFIYGLIEYFIIGKGGDESRSEHGRELFLKSIAWFVLALLVYAIVAFFGWISTVSFNPGSVNTPTMPRGGANLEQRESILEVPNTPTR